MKTFVEFQILGRIGKVREVGQTTRISICANYAFKDLNGETKDRPYWNEITIWSDSARKYVGDYRLKQSRARRRKEPQPAAQPLVDPETGEIIPS
ncbi:MAG: hypothetical protein ACR65U_14310 [Methylocystis sp.]